MAGRSTQPLDSMQSRGTLLRLLSASILAAAGCASLGGGDPVWSAVITPDQRTPGIFVVELRETPAIALTYDGFPLQMQVHAEMRRFAERLAAERGLCPNHISYVELTFIPGTIQIERRFTLRCA